jgi:hypothetical protein
VAVPGLRRISGQLSPKRLGTLSGLTFGICRRRYRKREDSGVVACIFSRLRMARGVQHPVYGF